VIEFRTAEATAAGVAAEETDARNGQEWIAIVDPLDPIIAIITMLVGMAMFLPATAPLPQVLQDVTSVQGEDLHHLHTIITLVGFLRIGTFHQHTHLPTTEGVEDRLPNGGAVTTEDRPSGEVVHHPLLDEEIPISTSTPTSIIVAMVVVDWRMVVGVAVTVAVDRSVHPAALRLVGVDTNSAGVEIKVAADLHPRAHTPEAGVAAEA
jgi:hypothetical protein